MLQYILFLDYYVKTVSLYSSLKFYLPRNIFILVHFHTSCYRLSPKFY